MKTPQERAKELVKKYVDATNLFGDETCEIMLGQQLALIDVQNTIKELMWVNFLINSDNPAKEILNDKIKEMQEVKKEIEKL